MSVESFKLDFVGVAAPRSGTTWISRCLGEHPDICVSMHKEPHFFFYDSRYNQGLSWLVERQFAHWKGEKITGEWSNMYLYSKEAAERIKKHNPHIKIIMCLRDPVERAYSQYINRKYNASIMPLYSFKYVVDHESKYKYLSWGKYSRHIRFYQTLFPKENIYTMFYEEWVANPQAEMKKLLTFLGVEANFAPPSLYTIVSDRGKKKYYSIYVQGILNKLTLLYRTSRYKHALAKMGVRRLLRFLERKNRRGAPEPFEKPPMSREMRKKLQEYYVEEIQELEVLTEKNLDFWRK